MKCTNPFEIRIRKFGADHKMNVPCMYCRACRINKCTEWSIRILGEMNTWETDSCFLTLKYDDEHVPITDGKILSLRKNDIQKFHKRLRERLKGRKIKYFVGGEYGEETNRPHYHGIYLGLNGLKDKREIWEAWGKGSIYFGTVTEASIRYCVSYIFSKDKAEAYGDAEQPFQLNSNNFGTEWVQQNYDRILEKGYLPVKGKRIPIPKYIKEKFNELQKHPWEIRMREIEMKKEALRENATENWNTLKNIEKRELKQLEMKLEEKFRRKQIRE